jgi:hypothetical protein
MPAPPRRQIVRVLYSDSGRSRRTHCRTTFESSKSAACARAEVVLGGAVSKTSRNTCCWQRAAICRLACALCRARIERTRHNNPARLAGQQGAYLASPSARVTSPATQASVRPGRLAAAKDSNRGRRRCSSIDAQAGRRRHINRDFCLQRIFVSGPPRRRPPPPLLLPACCAPSSMEAQAASGPHTIVTTQAYAHTRTTNKLAGWLASQPASSLCGRPIPTCALFSSSSSSCN